MIDYLFRGIDFADVKYLTFSKPGHELIMVLCKIKQQGF